MAKNRFRVLIVDDDMLLRQLAGDILSAEYEVEHADDGQDAWEKAVAWRPHLVITDLMMPRMHGYELCERLKGREGIEGVRVLVISSKSFATDRSQAAAAGADAYLVKPYSMTELREKVRSLLSGDSPAPASTPERTPADEGARVPAPAPAPVPAAPAPEAMYVKFWGTRGSCPTGGAGTVRYGGNTACIEVRVGGQPLILDCGTGLRDLGNSLVKEYAGRPLEGHVFVGHTHWDHIQGFPFFGPLYNPANTFTIYGVRAAHGSLQKVFSGSMASDYFPIPLTKLAAKLRFVEMGGPVELGAARVSFHHLNHPGICIGFRIEAHGRVVTYLGDRENLARLNGETALSLRHEADLAAFAAGSDLIVAEAQYTEAEYPSRKGWGHSTFQDTVRFAVSAGAKRLAVFHHDPDHTDEMMDGYIEDCREQARKAGSRIECFAARDGLKIDL